MKNSYRLLKIEVKKDQVIGHPGFFLLTTGKLEVMINGKIMYFVTEGNRFGYATELFGDKNRTKLKAVEDCVLERFTHKEFIDLYYNNLEFRTEADATMKVDLEFAQDLAFKSRTEQLKLVFKNLLRNKESCFEYILKDLAVNWEVSERTIQRVLRELEEEGYRSEYRKVWKE